MAEVDDRVTPRAVLLDGKPVGPTPGGVTAVMRIVASARCGDHIISLAEAVIPNVAERDGGSAASPASGAITT